MADEDVLDDQQPLDGPLDTAPDADVPVELAEPIVNRFLFVDVAAQRAKQLRRGARARLGDVVAPHKLERVAMEEVRQQLVQYSVPAAKSVVVEVDG